LPSFVGISRIVSHSSSSRRAPSDTLCVQAENHGLHDALRLRENHGIELLQNIFLPLLRRSRCNQIRLPVDIALFREVGDVDRLQQVE
jgi:hypothetical protein